MADVSIALFRVGPQKEMRVKAIAVITIVVMIKVACVFMLA